MYLVYYLDSWHKSKTPGISRVTGVSSAVRKVPFLHVPELPLTR